MHTAFFGLPNNSQVIRVRGAAAPRVFLTRITCYKMHARANEEGIKFGVTYKVQNPYAEDQ